MLKRDLASIDADDILRLVAERARESLYLDYKEGTPDKDWESFTKDITAFSNTYGGDIVYGITEARDEKGKKLGYPDKDDSKHGLTDDLLTVIERVENWLRDNDAIQPRLKGLQLKIVEGIGKGNVLVARVPKSFNRPHMVSGKGLHPFYTRGTQSASPMNVHQIRQSFDESTSPIRQMSEFYANRIVMLRHESGGAPVKLRREYMVVVHVLPVAAFGDGDEIPARKLAEHAKPLDITMDGRANSQFFNLDGILKASMPKDGEFTSYTQVFRDGCVEGAAMNLFCANREGFASIVLRSVTMHTANLVHRAIRFNRLAGIEPPLFTWVTLMNVKNMREYSPDAFDVKGQPIPRIEVSAPPVIINNLDLTYHEVGKEMRPIFDVLYQACGRMESFDFDDEGNWNPRSLPEILPD